MRVTETERQRETETEIQRRRQTERMGEEAAR